MSAPLILDDGLQFGLGVFETIAAEHGHGVLLESHLAAWPGPPRPWVLGSWLNGASPMRRSPATSGNTVRPTAPAS